MGFMTNSLYFGILITILGYFIGDYLRKKLNLSILNPILIGIIFVGVIITLCKVEYKTYYEGAKYISFLLTPATICLAIPLYEEFEILKHNLKAVILGITAGVLSSLGSILAFSYMFMLTHEQYITLLPKSITTAIGMSLSSELGGIPSLTVAIIIITGIFGNLIGEYVCKIFKITEPVSVGLAFGTASHAVGTAKALELGEVEGAMSGLSVAVSGIITVVLANVFAVLL
ncbi:LrgB family protein [Anaerofustis stercorihominis]|uniref:LrgB family protein n=1 Tax=Anaerofustis stercorihominis TaxID=214853 RepID=A0A3E3E0Q3_9FIRM|nr:LrgB family protein [Anaerofustis stercorihominis]MCQ4794316.1 LrgB family protein [Anaerofustis stercorihominis]RGD74518.1 LrgB family protein [Anaerofustis stercorihominis]